MAASRKAEINAFLAATLEEIAENNTAGCVAIETDDHQLFAKSSLLLNQKYKNIFLGKSEAGENVVIKERNFSGHDDDELTEEEHNKEKECAENEMKILKLTGDFIGQISTGGFIRKFQVGENLQQFLKDSKDTLSSLDLLNIANNLLLAVKKLHDKGICHGDIGEPNVIINPTDFSIGLIDLELGKLTTNFSKDNLRLYQLISRLLEGSSYIDELKELERYSFRPQSCIERLLDWVQEKISELTKTATHTLESELTYYSDHNASSFFVASTHGHPDKQKLEEKAAMQNNELDEGFQKKS